MRRFSFTLESVLTVKQKKLEDERIKLSKIMNELRAQKELLEKTIFEFEQNKRQADDYILKNNFHIEIITNFKLYGEKLAHKIKNQKELIKKKELELKVQQKATNQAYIDVKTLEKLKEKQKEKYDKELLQEEFKMIDDIVSSRHLRISY